MKTIEEIIEMDFTTSKVLDLYLPGSSFGVLDIETTGLSPAFGQIILTGLINVNGSETCLKQFFATSPLDEEEIIANTLKELSSMPYIITYNGRMFDIPFIQKRALKYGMTLPWRFNIDLYLLSKHYSDLSKFLPRLNQKTLEEYAGIACLREDRISGGESVDLYTTYMESGGNKDIEKRILLHNSDDVKQLLRLTSLYRNMDIHRAFYKTGFPLSNGRITEINLKRGELIIKGISNTQIEYISFPTVEKPYHFMMSGHDGSFSINLPCDTRDEDIFVDASFLEENLELLTQFPSFINGYVILKEGSSINYLTVNLLSKALTEALLTEL